MSKQVIAEQHRAVETLQLIKDLLLQQPLKPVSSLISEIFHQVVVSRDGKGLYAPDSAKAKVVRWIRGYETARSKEKQVCKIVLAALELTRESSPLSAEQRIVLDSYARKHVLRQVQPEPTDRRMVELTAQSRQAEAEAKALKTRDSLLRQPLVVLNPATEKPLRQLLGVDPEGSELSQYFETELGRVDRQIPVNGAALRKAQTEADDRQKKIDAHQDNEEARKAERISQAKALATRVQTEDCFFLGSYGKPVRTLHDLFTLYEKICEHLKKNAPASVGRTLDEGQAKLKTAEEMEKSVTDTIRSHVEQVTSRLPLEQATFLRSLFDDPERGLPRPLKAILPTPVANFLTERLQMGLLGNYSSLAAFSPSRETQEVLDFVNLLMLDSNLSQNTAAMFIHTVIRSIPSKGQAVMIDWVRQYGKDLTDPNPQKRQQALAKLETALVGVFRMPLDTILNPLVSGTMSLIQGMTDMVDPTYVRLLGLDGIIKTGPFWVRIKHDTAPGLRCLEIYSDAQGALNHPTTSEGGKVWPKVIKGVRVEALNEQFFDFLLFHVYESRQPDKSGISVDELYQTVETLVGGKVEKEGAIVPSVDSNIGDLFVFGKDSALRKARLRFNNLVKYCQPFIKGSRLEFGENLEARKLIQSGIQAVENDLKIVGSQIDSATLSAMKATLIEIGESVYNTPLESQTTPAIQDPNLLAEPLARQLRELGVTSRNFAEYGDLLNSLLGPDVMRILDLAIDSVDAIPAEQPQVQTGDWLRNSIRQIYLMTVFRMMRDLYFLYRLSSSPWFFARVAFARVTPAGFWEKILPTTVHNYLQLCGAVIEAIKQKITAVVLSLAFRLILGTISPETLKRFQSILGESAQVALGTRLISYDVKEIPRSVITAPIQTESSVPAAAPSNHFTDLWKASFEMPTNPISTGNIIEYLTRFSQRIALIQQNDDTRAPKYYEVMQLIRRLPIPQKEGSFWHDVSVDPTACLNLLGKISSRLMYLGEADNLTPAQVQSIALAQFHLLAIIEVLAKRMPEAHLNGYHVDATLLELWVKSDGCVLTDPDEIDYLEQIRHYFNSRNVSSKIEDALCHLHYHGAESASLSNSQISPADVKYIKALHGRLKAPPFSLDEAISAVLEPVINGYDKSPIYWKDCVKNPEDQMAILNALSYGTQGAEFIPLGYRMIRQQASHVVNTLVYTSKGSIKRSQTSRQHLWTAKIPHLTLLDDSTTKVSQIHLGSGSKMSKPHVDVRDRQIGTRVNLEYFETQAGTTADWIRLYFMERDLKHLRFTGFKPILFSELFGHLQQKVPLKEPDLYISKHATRSFVKSYIPTRTVESPNHARQYDIVPFIPNENRLAQALFLMRDSLSVHSTAIEAFFFHHRDIQKQLEDSPRIIEALAKAYQRMINDIRYWDRVALDLRRLCLRYQPAAAPLFPLPPYMMDEENTVWQFYAQGYPSDYSDPIALQEAACKAVHLYICQITPRVIEKQRILHRSEFVQKLLEEARVRCFAWCEKMRPLLQNDPAFRKRLFLTFVDPAQKAAFDALPSTAFTCQCDHETLKITATHLDRAASTLNMLDGTITLGIPLRVTPSQPAAAVVPVELPSRLAHLLTFAPKDQISCTYRTGTTHVNTIRFSNYGLTFEVSSIEGELRAVEKTQYPDYYIDPVQQQPFVDRFPSHLILRNRQGQRKVLIPAEQWQGSGLSYVRDLLGPLARPFAQLVPLKLTNKIFSYDVTDSGHLTSTDPAALAYLLQHYILQSLSSSEESIDLAEKVTEELAQLMRLKPVDRSLLESLAPLMCIPDQYNRLRNIRILLLASLEENRLVHQQNPESAPNEPIALFSSLIALGGVIRDLMFLEQASDVERSLMIGGGLTRDKEWFLYRYLIREGARLVDWQTVLPPYLRAVASEANNEAIIEAVLLPVPLQKRYQDLRTHYGIPEAKRVKAVKFATTVLAGKQSSLNLPKIVGGALSLPQRLVNQGVQMVGSVQRGIASAVSGAVGDKDLTTEAVDLLSQYHKDIKLSQADLLELHQLIQETDPATLDIHQITSSDLKKNFLAYYAVATGERGEAAYTELSKNLTYATRRFDRLGNELIKILQRTIQYRRILPSAEQLRKAHEKKAFFPILPTSSHFFSVHANSSDYPRCKKLFGFLEKNQPLYVKGMAVRLHKEFLASVMHEGRLMWWLTQLYSVAYHTPDVMLQVFGDLPEKFKEKPALKIYAEFLLEVAKSPHLHLEPGSFRIEMEKNKYQPSLQKSYEPWFSSLATLQFRCNNTGRAIDVSKVVAKKGVMGSIQGALAYYGNSYVLNSLIGWTPTMFGALGIKTAAGVADTTLAYGEEVGRLITSTPAKSSPDHPTTERGIPYAALDREDEEFDLYLKFLFDLVFKETKVASPDRPFQELPIPAGASPSVRQLIEKVNKSLRDHYHASGERIQYTLENRDNLDTLYGLVSEKVAQLEATEKEDEKQLFALVNPKQQVAKRGAITVRHLIKFVVEGRLKELELELKADHLQKLDFMIARHLARKSRLSQLKQTESALVELAHTDRTRKRAKYYELAEGIADQLRTSRGYKFKEIPSPRLVLRLLCFEAFSGKMIWTKQLKPVQEVLIGKRGDTVLELLMGMGKNVFAYPQADAFFTGEETVVNVFPAQMIGTNIIETAAAMGLYFNQQTNALQFSRDREFTPDSLAALKVVFQRAKERHETINMTREDAQAFKLKLIEMLFDYTRGRTKEYRDIEASMMGLKNLLEFFQTTVRLVGDEAHEELYQNVEQSWPVGPVQKIEEETFVQMERLMLVLAETDWCRALQAGQVQPLTQDVLSQIAAHYSTDPAVIAYLTEASQPCPAWLKQHPRYSELSLVRGALTILLPRILELKPMVQFGSKTTPFAAPFDGNMSQLENSIFANPDLTLQMTIIIRFMTGLKPEEVTALYDQLLKLAREEAQRKNTSLQNTVLYQKLQLLFPTGYDVAQLQKDPKVIMCYVEHFVLPSIKFWKHSIRSNSHDYASLFKSQTHGTGTPYNEGTYPDHLDVLEDPGTLGMALHIASNRSPANGVQVLEHEAPAEVLDEVLEKYFADPELQFSALIDGSARLQGLTSRVVVQRMVAFIQERRPDIKGVVFYEKDSSGIDQRYCWEVGAATPIPYELSRLTPEERISYYDDKHGFAANIPQPRYGKAVNLVDEKVKLYRLLQEIFRMRGLKFFQKLIQDGESSLEDLESQMQEVHFAITRKAEQNVRELQKDAPAQLHFDHLVPMAVQNQGETTAPDNYDAQHHKVDHALEQHFWKSILKAKSAKEMGAIFKRHEELWIRTLELDPVKSYGPQATTSAPEAVIAQAKKLATKKAEGKLQLDKLKKHPLPEEVTTYAHDPAHLRSLTSTATLSVKQMQEQKETQKRYEQNTTVLRSKRPGSKLVVEKEWDPALNPYNPEWRASPKIPALWSVQAQMARTTALENGALSRSFDPRLWVSDNVLPQAANLELGDHDQRQVMYLLVHAKKTPQGLDYTSVGAISVSDADYWKKRLRETKEQTPDDQRVFLFDVLNKTAIWGDPQFDLAKDPNFLKLLVQFKYLDGQMSRYSVQEMEALKQWAASNRSDCHLLLKALTTIHNARSGKEPFKRSTLVAILEDFATVDTL